MKGKGRRGQMNSVFIAAITNPHSLNGLNNTNVLSLSSVGKKSNAGLIKVLTFLFWRI